LTTSRKSIQTFTFHYFSLGIGRRFTRDCHTLVEIEGEVVVTTTFIRIIGDITIHKCSCPDRQKVPVVASLLQLLLHTGYGSSTFYEGDAAS
jgi:hypothetical protein